MTLPRWQKRVLFAAVPAALLAAAALFWRPLGYAPPSASVRAFGDQQHWIVVEDMTWRIGASGLAITVPRGFVTDLASTPRALWSLGLTPQGRYGRAAIVHDYLYWTQTCTRGQSDSLMLVAMKESGVDNEVADRVYSGVALFGSSAWAGNQRERQAGAFRVLPPELMRPDDANQSWPDYRASLAGKSIRDPASGIPAAACALGDSNEVPVAAAPAGSSGR